MLRIEVGTKDSGGVEMQMVHGLGDSVSTKGDH
jgi:hypothetical protein